MGIQINGTNGLDLISATDGSLTIEGAGFRDLQQLNVVGIATFQSDVSIAGTLTYEDVTNVESIGVATFRDNVHIGVGATTALFDVSTGNVGIGTDNPQYKLEVQQPSTPTIAVRNTEISSYSRLIAGGSDSTGEFFAFQRLGSTSSGKGGPKAGQIWNYADAPIVMGIGSTEILRITSTGDFVVGGGATFGSSVGVVTYFGDGSQLSGISVGLTTEATTPSNAVTELDLTAAQDHKVTATGICTITVTGGTEADSHTIRIVNSGIATVGFSTYFLFPSGATPSLPTADGAISLISFTVNRVGAAGTQLLAGASVNFS